MSSQTTTSDLPTIVCVHRAYHTPRSLEPFLSSLKRAGFEVHAPRLPTCNAADPSNSSFVEDVATVHKTLSVLIGQYNKRVMVVMQSYGGMPASEAVNPSLLYSARKSQGLAGGMVHLFYLCSMIISPPHTMSIIVSHGNTGERLAHLVDNGTVILNSAGSAAAYFYSDVEDEELVRQTFATPVPLNIKTILKAGLKGEAWKQAPATYLQTTKDVAINLKQQDMMLENIKQKGSWIEVVTWDCGHSPFMNRLKELVQLIKTTAQTIEL